MVCHNYRYQCTRIIIPLLYFFFFFFFFFFVVFFEYFRFSIVNMTDHSLRRPPVDAVGPWTPRGCPAKTRIRLSGCCVFAGCIITKKKNFSNILKFYHQKWKFSSKNFDIFHISAQNIDCGYSLELSLQGGPNEYPQSVFLSRNKITSQFKYTEILPPKMKIFRKKVGYVSYFCSKHWFWILVRTPWRCGSYECPQSMLLSRNKENNVHSHLNSSNTDGSFTMANSNSFLSPYEIDPIDQENKYLRKLFYFIMKLYVVCTHENRLFVAILTSTRDIQLLCRRSIDFPELAIFASWPDTMINLHWLEIPMTQTIFRGPRGVWAIEVWLYTLFTI